MGLDLRLGHREGSSGSRLGMARRFMLKITRAVCSREGFGALLPLARVAL